MKWLRTLIIINSGDLISSSDWLKIHESYIRAIKSIDFPEGTGTLCLRRKTRKGRTQWNRNGVGYIKKRFFNYIVNIEGWRAESNQGIDKYRRIAEVNLFPSKELYNEPIKSDFGDFDFVTTTENGMRVAIEWETGNISSSHRSLNKLTILLRDKKIQAGVLIVPSRELYEHLTDRIGNINELSAYLSIWKGFESQIESGILAITVVEHDLLTDDPNFQYLPTGKDGRAFEGQSRED
jgi:hypothetical protein